MTDRGLLKIIALLLAGILVTDVMQAIPPPFRHCDRTAPVCADTWWPVGSDFLTWLRSDTGGYLRLPWSNHVLPIEQ
jgi:hypothetical protein